MVSKDTVGTTCTRYMRTTRQAFYYQPNFLNDSAQETYASCKHINMVQGQANTHAIMQSQKFVYTRSYVSHRL